MFENNPLFKKLSAKYDQIKGKIKEMRANAEIRKDLKEREEEIRSYLEDLQSDDNEKVTAASGKVEQAMDALEKKVDELLAK